jgi:RecT family
MSQALTTAPHPLRPQNFGELVEFAKMAARSTLVPRDYLGKPENILLAIQMGSEIGLAPMQSLQNISVINGRPAVWGDAMLGLCRQSPVCKDVVERFEGEGKTLTAICIAKRAGAEPIERRFSMDDAERAGLASKAGTWQQYPKRMLQMRARGFALRDAFPDVLRGLISAEEAEDIPTGKTIEGTADATNEPSSLRQAINDATPMQPLRSVAAATPRAPRVVDPTPYEAPPPKPVDRSQWTDGMWRSWIDAKLRPELDKLTTREDVAVLAEKTSVRDAIDPNKAPEWVRRDVNEILADYHRSLPEAEPGDDLDDVVIKGEEHLAAG